MSSFSATPEAEVRLLLLIDRFTTPSRNLEGRTKLAKLDFFIRYPAYLRRALEIRGANDVPALEPGGPIDERMVRFRYGPWDPAYFAVLGSLIGRQLVLPVSQVRGIGYRSTDLGHEAALDLAGHDAWSGVALSTRLVRRHLDLSGTNLMKFVYEHFPEVTDARWGDLL